MSLEGKQESREAEAFHTVVQRVRERKGREEMGEDERRRGQKTSLHLFTGPRYIAQVKKPLLSS